MRPIIILILVHSIFFNAISCNGKKLSGDQNVISKVIYNDYKYALEVFPENLTKHFPKNPDTSIIGFTDILSPEVGTVRLDLTSKYSDEKKIRVFIDSSIAAYSAGDTCLLIGHRKATRENYLPENCLDSINHQMVLKCSGNLVPVPNFWQNEFSSDSTACKLEPEFMIYVLEAKPGIYAGKEYLSTNIDFPSDWNHGFSRGVAVSEKKFIIIYWLILW